MIAIPVVSREHIAKALAISGVVVGAVLLTRKMVVLTNVCMWLTALWGIAAYCIDSRPTIYMTPQQRVQFLQDRSEVGAPPSVQFLHKGSSVFLTGFMWLTLNGWLS